MLRHSPIQLVLIAGWCSVFAWAQDEAALRRYFEGKQVRVKYDLPATHDGLDVYWRQDPPVNFKAYSQRIKKFGIALRDGDTVRVTTVRVKQKNIEFQLGGGGYGTFGDDTSRVTARSVSKSSREAQLERDISKETDSRRRDQMNRELNRLRDDRRRDEAYARQRAAELDAVKSAEIARKRLDGGSRINLWFPPKYLVEQIPTPNELIAMLTEYIDFGGSGRR